jgi:DNA-directed RNA polymerase subunit RPC12/RpoP
MPLKRRCLDCGAEFFGSVVPPRDYSKCFQCDYNLTGNTSGRCPECGWKLSEKHIEFLRREAGGVDHLPQ